MKLLYSTDFSNEARTALANLQLFVECYHPTIYFIHVLGSFYEIWFSSRAHWKEVDGRLKHWQRCVGDTNDDHRWIDKGNVAERIVAKGKDLAVDYIVLGSTTEGKGRYHSADVIPAVVRGSHNSVWVAKNQNIGKILCCIDGSPTSAKSLVKAAEFANDFGAELSIVHVLPKADFNPLGLAEEEIKQLEREFQEKQQAHIDQFIDEQLANQLQHKRYYHWGKPAHVILNMAEDEQYDLIVMGAKGHSQLFHVLIGSTTEKVLRYSPCSMAIIK
jgi:nucleotide-binding universal stress UspA family protein